MSNRVTSALALTLLMTAACAQPVVSPPPERLPVVTTPLRLTPIDAARLAAARSTDIAISEQQVAAARGILAEARSIRQPRVEAQATYTRLGPGASFELPPEFGGETIDFAPTSQHRETLQVSVPLYLGGRAKFATRAARAGVEAAQEDIGAVFIEVALSAGLASYRILRLQQLVVVAEQRLTAVAEHLRIARAMFDAGTVPRFEVVQAETELARARGDIIHARTAVAQEQALLTELLVLPQGTELVVEEGIPIPLPEGERPTLIQAALEHRPEVPARQARVRIQEANVRLAQSNDDLSLSLVGRVNNQTATAASSSLNWDVTLALTAPLYQGSETKGRVLRAQAALETARLNLERVEQTIALQVTQAALNVQDAQEALTVAEQGEREARERLTIAQVRFANGVSLGVEVLDAQTALAAAQTQVINARYDLQIATLALWGALGRADFLKEPQG